MSSILQVHTLSLSFLTFFSEMVTTPHTIFYPPPPIKVEAVIDGWLYDHELVALKNFCRAMAVLLIGGLALVSALTRDPKVEDPAAVRV